MKILKTFLYAFILNICFSGCAAPLKTDTISFKHPSQYRNYKTLEGLHMAIEPIDLEAKSIEIFGTDMKSAEILPIHLIVHNGGFKEFEINHRQVFGGSADNEFTVAYNLNKAAEHVRNSSIGTTAAAGAVAGGVAGAALGVAMGAGIGVAAGDASTGAASGAIIGGSVGAASGLGAGLSDSFTVKFKKELANLAFENRVIFPGDLQQGFIYLKWKPYTNIRIKLFNITDNRTNELIFDVLIRR